MANIVITSSTNAIDVDFNDLSGAVGYNKGAWAKSKIIYVKEFTDYVKLKVQDGGYWDVSYNGTTGTLTVDTVDAVAPTSNSDLYLKITALLG